jgi:hypothetical protein
MRQRLRLCEHSVKRLLAVCCQADRSVDAVAHRSQSNWQRLREFYSADKRRVIQCALADLGISDPVAAGLDGERIPDDFSARTFPLVNALLNRFRSRWTIPQDVQRFLVSCLRRLSTCLDREEQPAPEDLVSLRLDLTAAASYLDNKLAGLPGLATIRAVEYYAPPAGKRLYPIHEALREGPDRRQLLFLLRGR